MRPDQSVWLTHEVAQFAGLTSKRIIQIAKQRHIGQRRGPTTRPTYVFRYVDLREFSAILDKPIQALARRFLKREDGNRVFLKEFLD